MSATSRESAEWIASALNFFLLASLIGGGFILKRKLQNSKAFQQMMDPTQGIMGKKKFEAIKPENITTKFEDVAGMHEAKS